MARIYRLSHIIKERYTDVGVGGSHFSFPVGVAHTYGSMKWEHETVPKPTEAQLIKWMNEKNAESALAEVRVERNKKLVETDWTQGADVPVGIKTTYQTYGQILRDLPTNGSKWTMDDNGMVSIDWPSKPSLGYEPS